jgi:hypothetical protein
LECVSSYNSMEKKGRVLYRTHRWNSIELLKGKEKKDGRSKVDQTDRG